jgi:hypothetical protein
LIRLTVVRLQFYWRRIGVLGEMPVEVWVQKSSMLLRTAAMGAVVIFDLTGVIVYVLLRRALAVSEPDRSPIEVFQMSARTISAAYHEAVGGARP